MATEKIYSSPANWAVIDYLESASGKLLDIGCGDGANARALIARNPKLKVWGVTFSIDEAMRARQDMAACYVVNVEETIPLEIAEQQFDILLFSHILEHTREPRQVVSRFLRLLKNNGRILIILPNILSWRMRVQFLGGDFEYQKFGVLDETHLRFFTFDSAAKYFSLSELGLIQTAHFATGSVPLFLARRYLLPSSWCARIDRWGCDHWPNLFGSQVILELTKIQ